MSAILPAPSEGQDSATWPLRAWGLAVLGAVAGLLVYAIARPDKYLPGLDHAELRAAAASFVAVAATLFAFLVEREKVGLSALFALIGGSVVGLALYWNRPFDGNSDGWRIVCSGLAVAIATPLFQAWRDANRSGTAPGLPVVPYSNAYRHA